MSAIGKGGGGDGAALWLVVAKTEGRQADRENSFASEFCFDKKALIVCRECNQFLGSLVLYYYYNYHYPTNY